MKLAPEQCLAIWRLSRRMNCDTAGTHRRLVSVALYALGMDPAAETDARTLTLAAVGPEEHGKSFDAVAEAAAESWGGAADWSRAERDASRTTPAS